LQGEIHLPLLSANLLGRKGGTPTFKSHVVFDLDGIRVGVFGLTSDARHNESVPPEGYFVSDPISTAKRVAAELAKDCDIIVALSNLGSFKEYSKLVQQAEGIHFILGSGGKRSHHQIIRSDGGWKTLLFQLYPKGQYLGRVDLKIIKGARDFVDLRRKVQLERQINSIERQLESYRKGTGRAKSMPEDKRNEYINRLEEYKKKPEAQLNALEKDSRRNNTFMNTPIRLDGKIREDPEIKELVDRFKKGL
jgi:2',3'-cyclic-nucleotide 2'-phosphodiesterase (5'-nucleotidase family)